MTIDLLSGEAAANAASDNEFAGLISPRHLKVGESLAAKATGMLAAAFGNQWGADVKLAEAFSTSDFKLAAAAELDKEMLAQYDELPTVWDAYTDQTTVRDFRPKRLQSRWRTTVGFDRVPELTEYPADDRRGATEYAIAVAKFGRRFSLSWEAWMNNEAIGELEDLPSELARQARETEMIAAVSNLLLVDPLTNTASDVNTAFFKSANGNAPTGLPLNRENLKAVWDSMAVRKDPNSKRVIARPEMVLVIPKSLEATVNAIVRPTEVRFTDANGVVTIETNEFSSLSFVVEPMLDFINTNAKAGTTWFLVPKPRSTRPALWVAKLAGHEQPDLRVKASTGQRVGGGDISFTEGSFEIDDIQYRGPPHRRQPAG